MTTTTYYDPTTGRDMPATYRDHTITEIGERQWQIVRPDGSIYPHLLPSAFAARRIVDNGSQY